MAKPQWNNGEKLILFVSACILAGMATPERKVFESADTNYLESAAKKIGLEVRIPNAIHFAQQRKPRVEGELEPVEVYLLWKIAQHIENGGEVPEGFVVYLNDRAHKEIQEDIPTRAWRRARLARSDLFEAVQELSLRLREKK
jgi:hypothetical protein